MIVVLWAGAVAGAVIGLLHAGYVYRMVAVEGQLRAGYYTLWTFGLWLVFGTYILVFWIKSVVAYAIAGPFRWRM